MNHFARASAAIKRHAPKTRSLANMALHTGGPKSAMKHLANMNMGNSKAERIINKGMKGVNMGHKALRTAHETVGELSQHAGDLRKAVDNRSLEGMHQSLSAMAGVANKHNYFHDDIAHLTKPHLNAIEGHKQLY